MMEAILSYAVSDDDSASSNWNFVWGLYVSSSSAAEKKSISRALAQTTDEEVIKDYITRCMDPDLVRTSNGLYIIGRVISKANKVATQISIDLLVDQWLTIYNTFKTLDLEMSTYVTTIVSQVSTEADLERITATFEDRDTGELLSTIPEAAYRAGVETAKSNIAWIAKNQAAIEKFVDEGENDTD